MTISDLVDKGLWIVLVQSGDLTRRLSIVYWLLSIKNIRQAFGESMSGICSNDEYAVFCTVYTH